MSWTEEDLESYLYRNEQRTVKKTLPTEEEEQIILMTWSEYLKGALPELRLMFHIPNGGSRNVAEAGKLKAMGVKKGVPDLFLPVPRGIYHGLFIELKRWQGGKMTPEQEAWMEDLSAMGYCCKMCNGFESAKSVIERYFALSGTEDLEGSDAMI